MIETPSDRLRKRRIELGFKNAADAARRFGWGISTYRSHENNSRGTGVPKWAAEEYARVYKVSLDWLMTGAEHKMSHSQIIGTSGVAIRYVPLVTLLQVKQALVEKVAQLQSDTLLPVAHDEMLGLDAFAITVEDDSMTNVTAGRSFPRGNELVFDPDTPVMPGDFCLAVVAGEDFPVFRRYMAEAVGVVRLDALNPAFRSYWIREGVPGRILARAMFRVERF